MAAMSKPLERAPEAEAHLLDSVRVNSAICASVMSHRSRTAMASGDHAPRGHASGLKQPGELTPPNIALTPDTALMAREWPCQRPSYPRLLTAGWEDVVVAVDSFAAMLLNQSFLRCQPVSCCCAVLLLPQPPLRTGAGMRL